LSNPILAKALHVLPWASFSLTIRFETHLIAPEKEEAVSLES
jgi:hypothetical protein